LGIPRWFGLPQSRVGVMTKWRTLDQYNPRYCPTREPDATGSLECVALPDGPLGTEWEIRTYFVVSL
ncbi:MAG: hypothetical protein R3344_13775, partial [Acidobacteriota bacterium]|nr:hypothetical protein [Acidobacteriota bacterium]